MRKIKAPLLLLTLSLCSAPTARAQDTLEEAHALRQQAEDAFFEMSLERAQRLIGEAIATCLEGVCPGEDIAELYMTRAIIEYGATNDEERARAAFRQALEADREVELDPMHANAELQAIFGSIRVEMGIAEGSAPTPSETARASERPVGNGQTGAPCSEERHCAEGLECRDYLCQSPSGPGEEAYEQTQRESEEQPVEEVPDYFHRFFFEAGYTLTMASAHDGMTAASVPTLATPGDDPQTDAIPENDSFIAPGTNGCDASAGEYCVRVTDGLTFLAHGLHLSFGAWLAEDFGVAARVRYAPNAGSGTLSHVNVGFRGYYRFVVPRPEGFGLSVFGGLNVGQIQVRPKQEPTPPAQDVTRPWAETGLGGLEVGGTLSYRFHPSVGLFATPELYLLFPNVSFGIQATVGVEVSFGRVGETEAEVDDDPDGDGIRGDDDRCPTDPEDVDGHRDEDGCPDSDNDGDGILDADDRCRNVAEDLDGFEDDDGCPDLDDDQDGIPDDRDRCPRQAGPAENEGCPQLDRDEDGVPDRFDNCPDEAGPPENLGCIEEQLVEIEDTRLRIREKVYFQLNSDQLQRRSFALLDNIAAVLENHPDIAHLRIEGHTDSRGSAAHNERLSQRRAESVMRYLVEAGVDQNRLSAHGYGESQPVHEDAESAEEHAANRRVGFTILRE